MEEKSRIDNINFKRLFSSYFYWILFFLILLSITAQVIPFLVDFSPENDQSSITIPKLPQNLPVSYDVSDHLKAEKYNRPFIPGIIIVSITIIIGLLMFILSGVGETIENKFGHGRWTWAARCLFFFVLYIVMYLLDMPYRVSNYFHCIAFELTDMSFLAWLKVLAIQFPVPLSIFVLKCLFIFCLFHLFNKRWWLVAAILIFIFFKVTPEFFQNRPIDPISILKPLEAGQHREQLENVSRLAGVKLDFLVTDHSKREKTVNIYLSGRASNRYLTLTDTFLEKFSPSETGVALAHELGHKKNDIVFLILYKTLTLLYLLAGFLLAFFLTGRKKIEPSARLKAVIVVLLCLCISNFLFLPASGAISRLDERIADNYALELTGDADSFISLIVKGAKINLERLEVSPWEYFLFSDYPNLRERISYAKKFNSSLKPKE
jgi:STE24 endopeptidase